MAVYVYPLTPVSVSIGGGLATETTLAAVQTAAEAVEVAVESLDAKDFATETTLAALAAEDFATETTLNQIELNTASIQNISEDTVAIRAKLPDNLTVTATRLLTDGSGVTQPVSGTITAVNSTSALAGTAASAVDIIESTEVAGYAALSVQLTGISSSTVQVQFSNDNSNWLPSPCFVPGNYGTSSGIAINLTTNNLFVVPVQGRYMRVRCTSYGSGTIAATAYLSASAPITTIASVNAAQSGTWNISNVSGTVSLPTGASTEATLSSLNAKVTAVNTGAVVVSSSALPSGASTSAKQDTQIAATQRNVVDQIDTTPLLDTSSTNIPASASNPVAVIASTAATAYKIVSVEDIGEYIGLYTGAAMSEVLLCVLPLGGGEIDVNIPAGTRISLRNMKNAAISSGFIALNLVG